MGCGFSTSANSPEPNPYLNPPPSPIKERDLTRDPVGNLYPKGGTDRPVYYNPYDLEHPHHLNNKMVATDQTSGKSKSAENYAKKNDTAI